MKIYNASGAEILDIQVDDSSVRYRSIMNDDSLTLDFSVTGPVSVPRGSYVDFEGARYTLFYPENFKKNSTRDFAYTLTLHGWREALKLYKYKDLSAKPYRLKFPLTARPVDFLQLLVDNLNLRDSGWAKGDCIEADEKLFSFNHEFCFDVLNRIAEEFNTEWEIAGKTIHLRKVEKFKDDPLLLSYGMGNGFKPGTGRQNDGDRQPIGLLNVQGGERNIDYSEYGSSSLLLPKSASLVYEGKTYRTDADGMYITRDGNTNIAEGSYDGSGHYPKRVGIVSHVIVVDADKHFYDIRDTSIPAALDYRDCRIAGEKATIVFQSGALAGREFDLEQTDTDLTGYIHADRRFKIVPAELDGQIMPGGVFVPQVGDKYAIFNISMPQAYISDNATKTGASWDMFREAVKYFAEEENDKFSFTGELDGVWSKSRWLEIGGKIVPGGHVLFSDPQFQPSGILIRITAIKDYVNKPHKPEITLSNAPVSGSFSADLGKLEAEEVVRESDKKDLIRYSKRQWRDAKETMSMLQQALLNFSGSINPITVQTMQLLVGDESLQFRFVNNKTNPSPVTHNVSFNPATKVLTATSGIIQHMTLGITSLKKSHAASEYKYWDMAAYTSPALDADKAYYLYARCAKSGTTGVFLLSETAIGMESVANQYHFLLGILNSEQDGDRSFAPLYGFTEILPGRITTDRIVSQDGKTYFDLDTGEIGGKITFRSTAGTDEDLAEILDGTAQDIQDAQAAANAAALKAQQAIDEAEANVTLINTEVGKLQAQLDGEVSNWFYPYSPTLANYPASEWTTTAEKDRHIGDTFTNTQPSPATDAGKSWRFVKNGSTYSWTQIADSDAVKALQQAAQAQATADGKSTTFLVQPSNYHLGDTWVLNSDRTINGTSYKQGEILTATQDSTTFVEAHWIKRVRYTDDSAVDNLQIGGVNLINGDTKLIERTEIGWTHIPLSRQLVEGKTYILGGEFRIDTGTSGVIGLNNADFNNGLVVLPRNTPFVATAYMASRTHFALAKQAKASPDLVVSAKEVKLEEGNKKTAWSQSPEYVQFKIDEAVVKATYWSVKASAPVIYKDAINAATSGTHTPVTVSGELRSGTATTAGGFITVTPNGGTEAGTASASPVTIAPANGDGKTSYTVRLYDTAAKTTLLDTMTIPVVFKGASGVNAINVVLSNEADVLPASPTGVVSDYAGSGTIIRVFEGATELDYDGIGTANGKFNVTASASGITAGTKSESGLTCVFANASNMTADNATIVFTITGKTADGTSFSLTKTQSFAKSRTGQKGDAGVSITNVDVEFAKNTNPTTAPTTGWSTTAPTLSGTEQLWTRTKTTYSSGSPTYSTPANITPKTGATGTSVTAVVEEYYLSTSNSTQTGGSWSEIPPTWVQGKYIWTRVKITYANPTSTATTTPYLSPEWDAINNTRLTAEQAQLAADGYMRARYVRDWSQGNSTNNLNQWSEIEVFNKAGTNIALGKIPTSNGTFMSANPASYATDGNRGTYAGINNATAQLNYVRIDLGGIVYDIDYISIKRPYADGRTYFGTKTEISEDGTNWTTIFDSAVSGTYQETEQGKVHTQRYAQVVASLNEEIAKNKHVTTIEGGVINSGLVKLYDAGTEENTSGLSGIINGNLLNPSFWSGGTYAQAVALADYLSAPTEAKWSNLAKIIHTFGGTSKMGVLLTESTGRVKIVDPATGNERLIFLNKNIPTVGTLLDETQLGGSDDTGSGVVTMTTPQVTLSGSVTVSQDNSTLTFGGTLMTITVFRGPGLASANVALRVYRNGSLYANIAGVSVIVSSGESGYNEVNTGVKVLTGVPAGTYTLRAELTWTGDPISIDGGVSTSTLAWSFSKNVEYFQFGLDGMMSWWQDFHVHMSRNGGFDGRALPSKWNAPGVLAKGRILLSGSRVTEKAWGAKNSTGTVTKQGTGGYRVPVNCPNAHYDVNISPRTANRTFMLGATTATYFEVYFRDHNGNLADSEFSYTIVGNNYN